jgi:hypothetical protein
MEVLGKEVAIQVATTQCSGCVTVLENAMDASLS